MYVNHAQRAGSAEQVGLSKKAGAEDTYEIVRHMICATHDLSTILTAVALCSGVGDQRYSQIAHCRHQHGVLNGKGHCYRMMSQANKRMHYSTCHHARKTSSADAAVSVQPSVVLTSSADFSLLLVCWTRCVRSSRADRRL